MSQTMMYDVDVILTVIVGMAFDFLHLKLFSNYEHETIFPL